MQSCNLQPPDRRGDLRLVGVAIGLLSLRWLDLGGWSDWRGYAGLLVGGFAFGWSFRRRTK